MRKFLFALLLLVPMMSRAQDSPNPANYTIAIHVQSSRVLYSHYGSTQQITAAIEGKTYKLEAYSYFPFKLLRVGDYKAKISKDSKAPSYEYDREYEFLFPDGRTRKYSVVGEKE